MRDISRIIVHMDYRSNIIEAKNRYCEITGLAPATVATKVANDGKFFDRIEAGKGFTMATYEKVMEWFKENTPKKKASND